MLAVTMFASPADSQGANPLLSPSSLPYGTIDFGKVTPGDYEEAVKVGIKKQKDAIDAIVKQRSVPTFENTIVALDRSSRDLNIAMLALSNVEHATGDPELMKTMEKVTPLLSSLSADIMLNQPLWERIKYVYDNREKDTSLTPEDMRLITETYSSFANNGANLKGADREKYRKLNDELSNLTLKFSQNLSNDLQRSENTIFLSEEEVAGLPDSYKASMLAEGKEALAKMNKSEKDAGGKVYLLTMYAPSYFPFMKYASDRDARQRAYIMYGTRNIGGPYDNSQLLKDIANVRMEIAQLLGKKSFAEYQLQNTMAGTPEEVYRMLNSLREAYSPALQKELQELTDFAKASEGADFKLMPWDYSYYSDKLKNSRYAFKDEELKPYFELNNTIKGVFGLATKLYGYKFKENKQIPGYHPDVKAYDVIGPDGKVLGVLYTDFYYRPGKAPGAWMTEFRTEVKDDNGVREVPIISIVMNFSKPVGNDPVLLEASEVNTFLHEFGHALHGLSAEAKYESLSGTNVYHDFVELFSQFNENYMTEQKFLDTFAKHYKTGKKMPKALLDKFVKSSQFGAAYACMRQLNFGFLDMAYYTLEEPLRAAADIEAFENKAIEPVKIFDSIEGCVMGPQFGHIFSGGYASGYYGYKWSEELDADAFSAFQETGNIFDKKTAEKFHKMLQAGGTVDPKVLYREFRGRDANADALLRRDGIK